ncbi:hypothetical protein N7512_002964 [Penicillium capsulatum]|nr:hypothetical protein N7512_002964 [Penicillium capsulatum]
MTFQSRGQLDFVFLNASAVERTNFYAASDIDEKQGVVPPPEPDLISLRAVIWTTHLARHYFRNSPHRGLKRIS